MTLKNVVDSLIRIALTQHNVRSAGYGDLYKDLLADPSIKWDVFYITPNTMQAEDDFDRFNLNLYYVSRLEDTDGTNMLQVHSIGKEILDNIVKIFCETYDCDVYGTEQYTYFTQRFSDLCAGLYLTVSLEVPKSICIDEE